jgi:thioredoxin reductase (NADPH)
MYEVAIIGGGPAGITAGIYGARKNLKTILFEEKLLGGTVNSATIVDDFPGIPDTQGIKLGAKFGEHLRKYGVEVIDEKVDKIEKKGDSFILHAGGKTFEAKTVVLATGSKRRKIGLLAEEQFDGKGISYCTNCDGPLYKGKAVAVVGGGDAALTAALYLSEIAKPPVYLIHRRKEFRADEATQKHVFEKEKQGKIKLLLEKSVVDLKGKNFLESIVIAGEGDCKKTELALNGLFVEIGSDPENSLAKQLCLELDERGCIKTDERMRTSLKGVYAAGDVTGRQARLVVAAAHGALAAIDAHSLVRGIGKSPK